MLSIKNRQKNLQWLGFYKGKIDGKWGNSSKQATKEFQKFAKITVDAIYGKNTDKKLIEVVKTYQKKLGANADGIAGANTIKKTKAYQKSKGLSQDGICGYTTRAKLNGTKVQRASLANPDTMRALGVAIGSHVVVVKRGGVLAVEHGTVGLYQGGTLEVVGRLVVFVNGNVEVAYNTFVFLKLQLGPLPVVDKLFESLLKVFKHAFVRRPYLVGVYHHLGSQLLCAGLVTEGQRTKQSQYGKDIPHCHDTLFRMAAIRALPQRGGR